MDAKHPSSYFERGIRYIALMQRRQGYKYELMPTGEQQNQLRRFVGNARKVWNLALDRQQQQHTVGAKLTSAYGMSNWLAAWKDEYPYLKDSPSQTLQQVMGDLAQAYKNFFGKRPEFPRFKKKGQRDSIRFPQGHRLDQGNKPYVPAKARLAAV